MTTTAHTKAILTSIVAGILFIKTAQAQNLVLNSGFDNGCTNWIYGTCTTPEIGSSNCSGGTYVESTYGGASTTNMVAEIDASSCIGQEICILKGQNYTVQFKASRRTNGAPATVGITVEVRGVSNAVVYATQNYSFTNTTFAFTNHSINFNIPAAATTDRVALRITPYNTTSSYGTIIDDVTIQPQVAYSITAPSGLCTGTNGSFSVNNLTGVTAVHNWSFSGGTPSSSSSATPSISWSSTGTHNYSVALSNATCTSATLTGSINIACTLPVDIISINATTNQGKTTVFWNVENEYQLQQYTIEGSEDGIHFAALGNVAAATVNGSGDYSFEHIFNIKEQFYYRIKCIDIDGTFKYSKIVVVRQTKERKISIFPNPAHSFVTVEFFAVRNEIIKLTLLDVTGKQVSDYTIKALQGSNSSNLNLLHHVNNKGIYYLKFNLGGEVYVKKIYIQ